MLIGLVLLSLLTCGHSTPFRKVTDNASGLEAYNMQLKATYPQMEDYNSSVLFYLFTRETIESGEQLWIDQPLSLKSSKFDRSKKTRVVVHGYLDDIDSDMIQLNKNALLKFENVNVIGVDWGSIAKNIIYGWVASETPAVGRYIGDFVNYLIEEGGVTPDQVHLIGHSLGAHAAGFAGKQLKIKNRLADRVSGLDPALPGFFSAESDSRISSTDAQFVDCIHTTANLLGFGTAICQADFYPNGGTDVQPGCGAFDFGICSHGRAYTYFAESVDPTHHFYSEICASVVSGEPYGCSPVNAEMGYYADPEALGEFYLTTNSASPFAENITARWE